VYVEFFVEADGTISEAKVLRGLCESCDREALRLIMGMPKWKPGTWHGKPKRTKMVMPVVFKM
jgi:periplasmic protein TonB